MLPQDDFRECHLPAKLTRESHARIKSSYGTMSDAPCFGPSTMLRMVPLPVPGRIFELHHRRSLLEQMKNATVRQNTASALPFIICWRTSGIGGPP